MKNGGGWKLQIIRGVREDARVRFRAADLTGVHRVLQVFQAAGGCRAAIPIGEPDQTIARRQPRQPGGDIFVACHCIAGFIKDLEGLGGALRWFTHRIQQNTNHLDP